MTSANSGGLGVKVAFLMETASYPEPTRSVQGVETHMSWVFLTDRFAYKLKKPVLLPFLDFLTPERRKHYCEEEIRLNRRLAPNVYIGTISLNADVHGALSLGGAGSPIDWLVKMHRLPADRMLDRAICENSFSREEIERVAGLLAAFYRNARRVDLTVFQHIERLESAVTENLKELTAANSILPAGIVHRIHAAQLAFLYEQQRLFAQRIHERRIVEGHGDLRPQHVVLGAEPQIIDRLEFNEAFRTVDPADELSFLAMECEILGAPSIGPVVFERYVEENADLAAMRLSDFYACYRACLRAKLAIWHLREPDIPQPEHWTARARRYVEIADRYAGRLSPAYVAMSATSESPA